MVEEKTEDSFYIEISRWAWERPQGGYELLEYTLKLSGIWRFHRNDPDPWPSKPHGHNLEDKEKLDVYTGLKYNITNKQCTGKLSSKELNELQEKLKKKGFIQ